MSSSSPTSRNRRFRLVAVALVFAISVTLTGILTIWNSDSSIASSPFANPGDILIAGGDVGANVFGVAQQALLAKLTASAQIYQLSSNTFVATSAMAGDREGATGTALPDGTILVAGGFHCTNNSSQVTCTSLNTAEIYDPVAGTFSSVGPMTSKRFGQSATLISCGGRALDGDVLIAGGDNGSLTVTEMGGLDESKDHAVNTAETYDYRTQTFAALTNTMNSAREAQAAVVIPNSGGKVALIGGDDKGFFVESVSTAEIFDPSNSTFTPTSGNMASPREIAPAVALDPAVVTTSLAGQILICGGIDAVNSGTLNGSTLNTCELLNPAGGGSFSTVSGTMGSPSSGESLTLLPSGMLAGQVLIAGGLDASGDGNGTTGLKETSNNTSDLFNPSGSSGTLTPSGMLNEARGGHAVALLTSGANAGDVLIAGGERCVAGSLSPNCYVVSSPTDQSNGGTVDAGELFDPDTQMWTPVTAAMQPPVNAAAGFGVPIPQPAGAGSPTATATSTSIASASPSASASASPSASPTASSTSSGSPSSTASQTAAPTASGTSGPTATATHTGGPTLAPTMTATTSPTAAPTVDATPTAAPTVSASLVVRPARMAFNNRKTTGTVTITNPNNRRQDSPIQITHTSLTGDFQAGPTTCGSSVAPGGSCTFGFVFKPTTFGKSPGTFTITDNSSTHSMSTVTLIGNLVLTPLTVTPARLNFGKEPMHAPSEPQNVTIHNNNPIAVTVANSSSGPDTSDYHIGGNCSGSISAGGSCMASVTFDPSATGNRRATLVISYANRKHNVPLIGVGTTGGPTPTATVAATATATIGATPTATIAVTATATNAGGTPTPSMTSSSTPTSSPSAAPTATLTIGLPTGTPTMTATSGPTNAPTPTATFTVPVPTITIGLPTATATMTATGGPTDAPTPTATFTVPIPTLTIALPTGLPTGLPSGISAP